MNRQDRSLVEKLALVLVIKLLVLTAMWWFLVHDQRLPISSDGVAAELLGSSNANSKE